MHRRVRVHVHRLVVTVVREELVGSVRYFLVRPTCLLSRASADPACSSSQGMRRSARLRLHISSDAWSDLPGEVVSLIIDLGVPAGLRESHGGTVSPVYVQQCCFETSARLMCCNTSYAAAVRQWRQTVTYISSQRLHISRPLSHDATTSLVCAAAKCPRLKTLAIGRGHSMPSDADWLALARGCTGLEKLELTGSGSPSRKALHCLARQCSLRVLRLQSVSDELLGALRALPEGFEKLAIDGSFAFKDLLTDHGLKLIGRHLPTLKRLKLPRAELSSDAVAATAHLFPCLEELCLLGMAELDDAAITAIAQHCPRLKKLDLRASEEPEELTPNWNVTGDAALALSLGLGSLTCLLLDGCGIPDVGLVQICVRCTQLETLSIRCCTDVTFAAVHAVAILAGCKGSHTSEALLEALDAGIPANMPTAILPKLVSLYVGLVNGGAEEAYGPQASDMLLREVATAWPQLQDLRRERGSPRTRGRQWSAMPPSARSRCSRCQSCTLSFASPGRRRCTLRFGGRSCCDTGMGCTLRWT